MGWDWDLTSRTPALGLEFGAEWVSWRSCEVGLGLDIVFDIDTEISILIMSCYRYIRLNLHQNAYFQLFNSTSTLSALRHFGQVNKSVAPRPIFVSQNVCDFNTKLAEGIQCPAKPMLQSQAASKASARPCNLVQGGKAPKVEWKSKNIHPNKQNSMVLSFEFIVITHKYIGSH